MFRKTLISALIATLASAPFFFLLQAQLSNPVIAIVLVFFATLISALLVQRKPAPARKRKTRSPRQRPASDGPRELGNVKWFNASKGFGFITRDSGDDVFVHFRSIRGDGHRVLKDGQRVEFSVSQGDKGLQADDVATV